MFRVRGILRQTFLVIVASFILVEVGQADGVSISIHPPSSEGTPLTVAVGRNIKCTISRRPYKSLKWYDNNWKLVSDSSALVVTEKMRSLKQPITLTCRALYGRDDKIIDGSYTFTVANAFSGADGFGEISFFPPSSMHAPTTLAVGTTIQCSAHGMHDPALKWYDFKGNNLVSESSGINVTEGMRNWKQPITLRCKAPGWSPTREAEGFYTFEVANAVGQPVADAVVRPVADAVVRPEVWLMMAQDLLSIFFLFVSIPVLIIAALILAPIFGALLMFAPIFAFFTMIAAIVLQTWGFDLIAQNLSFLIVGIPVFIITAQLLIGLCSIVVDRLTSLKRKSLSCTENKKFCCT